MVALKVTIVLLVITGLPPEFRGVLATCGPILVVETTHRAGHPLWFLLGNGASCASRAAIANPATPRRVESKGAPTPCMAGGKTVPAFFRTGSE